MENYTGKGEAQKKERRKKKQIANNKKFGGRRKKRNVERLDCTATLTDAGSDFS
jgi:hypothetical protein